MESLNPGLALYDSKKKLGQAISAKYSLFQHISIYFSLFQVSGGFGKVSFGLGKDLDCFLVRCQKDLGTSQW